MAEIEEKNNFTDVALFDDEIFALLCDANDTIIFDTNVNTFTITCNDGAQIGLTPDRFIAIL